MGGGCGKQIARTAGFRKCRGLKRIAILGYEKDGEIDDLRSRWDGTLLGRGVISHIQVSIQEALAMTHADWFIPVDAKHFCDVVPVYFKIGDHSQVIKTLQGHQKNESYGSDPVHKCKCRAEQTCQTMTEIMKTVIGTSMQYNKLVVSNLRQK